MFLKKKKVEKPFLGFIIIPKSMIIKAKFIRLESSSAKLRDEKNKINYQLILPRSCFVMMIFNLKMCNFIFLF